MNKTQRIANVNVSGKIIRGAALACPSSQVFPWPFPAASPFRLPLAPSPAACPCHWASCLHRSHSITETLNNHNKYRSKNFNKKSLCCPISPRLRLICGVRQLAKFWMRVISRQVARLCLATENSVEEPIVGVKARREPQCHYS